MGKHGVINSTFISCWMEIMCTLELEVTKEMMPKFIIKAFHVKYTDGHDYGSKEVSTKEIGENYVSV